jgi:hypothetical protein
MSDEAVEQALPSNKPMTKAGQFFCDDCVAAYRRTIRRTRLPLAIRKIARIGAAIFCISEGSYALP